LLLAEDNAAILEHVSRILAEFFDILAVVPNGETALRETKRLRPDVVVLDISMGGLSGIEVARRLRDQGPICKVVFLTVHQDCEFLNAALGAGGSAYVLKHNLGTDLVPAIRAAMAGKLFVSAALLEECSG
jgi:DNA-binding NarL/FixJ family response regulator